MSIQEQLPDTELGHALKESDFLEKHLNHLIMGVVGCLVLAALILWGFRPNEDVSSAWGALDAARSAEDFDNIVDTYSASAPKVAAWAQLLGAELKLEEAVRLLFTDRDAADEQLDKALDAFDELIEDNNSGDLKLVTARAILGRARVLEVTGDIDGAITNYKELQSDDYKEFGYEGMVKARIEALEKGDTGEFYTWFKDAELPDLTKIPRPNDLPFDHNSMSAPIELPAIPPQMFPAEWSDLKTDEGPDFEGPKAIDDGNSDTKKTDDAKTSDSANDIDSANDASSKSDDATNKKNEANPAGAKKK